MVTYSPSAENIDPKKMVIIWDIRTGIEKRSFSIDGTTVWPIFRWSKDDKYFARIGTDVLSVYETPVRLYFFLLTYCSSYFPVCTQCYIIEDLLQLSVCNSCFKRSWVRFTWKITIQIYKTLVHLMRRI